jgi:acyl carrier protein
MPRSDGHLDERTEQEVRETIRVVIAEISPSKDAEVRDDSRLLEDLEYTSLALLELAFTLEDEFDLLPITEEAARAVTTVGKLIDHVLGELRERAAQESA